MCLLPFARLALVAAGLAIVVSPLAAQRSDDQMERPQVRDVAFKGVKSVDQDQLRESIATRESKCRSILFSWICPWYKGDAVYDREYLDEKDFQRDVLRIKVFYWQRGFREAQVDTLVAPDGDARDTTAGDDRPERVRVTFRVTEGTPVRVRAVEVVRPEAHLTPRALRRLVLLRAGRPLDLLKLDSSATRLQQAMWQRGYADAQVARAVTVDSATGTARVRLEVQPNARTVVGDIHIHGDDEVSQRSIRNSLLFKSGDVFRLDRMLESQRALYESGLFRRAALFVQQTPGVSSCGSYGFEAQPQDDAPQADSIKNIEVCVEEAKLRDVRTSAGFNTVDFFQVEGRFSHYNFLGGARRLDIQGVVGNLLAEQLNGRYIFRPLENLAEDDRARYFAPTWQASADVRQRWFQSPRNTLGAGIFAHRRSSPGIFVDRGYGTSLSLTRLVAERAPVTAAYRFEITTIEAGDVYFCVNVGVCDRATIAALRSRQRLSPLILSATPDRANDPFSPTSGWRGRLELDHASLATQSDFRYNRGYADASVYRRVGARGTLATRLRLGFVQPLSGSLDNDALGLAGIDDVLHPRKRFYSGGSQSVRGFGENQLGPRVLTIPVEQLRGTNNVRCSEADIRDCDPNGSFTNPDNGEVIPAYAERDFVPRPLGGNALAEGSVEFRFPIRGQFIGAAFVDAGWLRGRTLGGGAQSDFAVTPGIGGRYRSPVGPIRLDLGFNPFLKETLPVITEDDSDGQRRLVRLRTDREYVPGRESSGITKVLNRLTLHLSIGEAF